MKTFLSMGDAGDVVFLCPCMKLVAKQIGSPVIFYAKDGLRAHDPFTAKIPLLAPLLENQDYIEAVRAWGGESIDYDAVFFRDDGLPFGETLAARQADWLKLSPDFFSPWLNVTPHREAAIIVNRTTRYQNPFFPWHSLVSTFGNEMLFIGLPHEHEAFCRNHGRIPYLPTRNLLKAAQVIAGSELFIGNQSCCNAICEGLKHNSIQETDLSCPDCIYPRANAIHCHNGALDLTFHGRHFASKDQLFIRAHLGETPPGGWQVKIGGQEANSYAFDFALAKITAKLHVAGMEVPENLKELIIEQNSIQHLDHPVTRLKARLGIA